MLTILDLNQNKYLINNFKDSTLFKEYSETYEGEERQQYILPVIYTEKTVKELVEYLNNDIIPEKISKELLDLSNYIGLISLIREDNKKYNINLDIDILIDNTPLNVIKKIIKNNALYYHYNYSYIPDRTKKNYGKIYKYKLSLMEQDQKEYYILNNGSKEHVSEYLDSVKYKICLEEIEHHILYSILNNLYYKDNKIINKFIHINFKVKNVHILHLCLKLAVINNNIILFNYLIDNGIYNIVEILYGACESGNSTIFDEYYNIKTLSVYNIVKMIIFTTKTNNYNIASKLLKYVKKIDTTNCKICMNYQYKYKNKYYPEYSQDLINISVKELKDEIIRYCDIKLFKLFKKKISNKNYIKLFVDSFRYGREDIYNLYHKPNVYNIYNVNDAIEGHNLSIIKSEMDKCIFSIKNQQMEKSDLDKYMLNALRTYNIDIIEYIYSTIHTCYEISYNLIDIDMFLILCKYRLDHILYNSKYQLGKKLNTKDYMNIIDYCILQIKDELCYYILHGLLQAVMKGDFELTLHLLDKDIDIVKITKKEHLIKLGYWKVDNMRDLFYFYIYTDMVVYMTINNMNTYNITNYKDLRYILTLKLIIYKLLNYGKKSEEYMQDFYNMPILDYIHYKTKHDENFMNNLLNYCDIYNSNYILDFTDDEQRGKDIKDMKDYVINLIDTIQICEKFYFEYFKEHINIHYKDSCEDIKNQLVGIEYKNYIFKNIYPKSNIIP